ncbi:MAG: protein NosL [Thiothrix sp.]|nr:MAG: protein NosL [Thiothrix sp.]
MNNKHFFKFSLASVVVLISLMISACTNEPETGPSEVRWDREICQRCAMAISDRNYSAQVRGAAAGNKTKLYKFDDLGCAVIWLDEQDWKDDVRTEIWVNAFDSGEWLDAKTAWYTTGKTTPMDYQLGATLDPKKGTLDFERAKKHIYEVEERLNTHNGQPLTIESSQ